MTCMAQNHLVEKLLFCTYIRSDCCTLTFWTGVKKDARAHLRVPSQSIRGFTCESGLQLLQWLQNARDVYVVSKEITSHNLFLQLVGNGA